MQQRKKRILCFIASLSAGGAERQMMELVRILYQEGFDIDLLTYAENDQYECPSYVKRHHVKCKNKLWLLLSLVYNIHKIKYDCCISFLTTNNMVACVAKCLKPCKTLIVGERNCSTQLTNTKKIAYQLYRFADYVVPNSFSESEFIKSHAPWLKKKTIPIQNYTDIEHYKPQQKTTNKKIDVGVFARYTKQKNPLYLAKVAKALKEQSYTDFVFHWYGNNQLNMLKEDVGVSKEFLEMESFIKENNLADSFYLNGFVNDISEEMAKMDVICLPSLYEGYPNAISEGMACGKAIIASRVSDVPYIVEDGQNGFLFDPIDIESGIRAFIHYYELSDKEKVVMNKRNREKAIQIFSKVEFTKKYLSLINS